MGWTGAPTHQTNATNTKSANEQRRKRGNKNGVNVNVMRQRSNANTKTIVDKDTMIDILLRMMKHIGVSIQKMIIIDDPRVMGLRTRKITTIGAMMTEVEGMMIDTKIRIAAMTMDMEGTRTHIDHLAVTIEEESMITTTATAIKVVRMNTRRMTAGLVMDTMTNRKMMTDIMDVAAVQLEEMIPMAMIVELMTIMSRLDHVVTEEVTIHERVRNIRLWNCIDNINQQADGTLTRLYVIPNIY